MAGEVIGINGRGSFKDRGRVNVGVGYAISIEQIKNFIPEMLATKVALHGTLNAVFGNRRAGVICYQLNLDSPIADAGHGRRRSPARLRWAGNYQAPTK